MQQKLGNAAKKMAIAATSKWKYSDQRSGIKHIIMGNAAYKNDKCRK